MTINYLFVINPNSGNTDKAKLESFIHETFTKSKKEYQIFHTSGKNDQARLKDLMREHSYKSLIACGGDGTVNMLASLLQKEQVLGIIPTGSANGLATELDIEDDMEVAMDIILKGSYIHMDYLLINKKHICLHLSDMGFNAKMIQEFEKQEERGMLSYAKAFFHSLREKCTAHYSITLSNKQIEREAEMIVFANASQYGTGAIINPGSAVNDGSFEVVIFKPIPLSRLPSLTFNSFLGDINDSEFVEIHKTKKVKVTCSTEELLQVDGEIKGREKSVEVEVIPSAIKVYC